MMNNIIKQEKQPLVYWPIYSSCMFWGNHDTFSLSLLRKYGGCKLITETKSFVFVSFLNAVCFVAWPSNFKLPLVERT